MTSIGFLPLILQPTRITKSTMSIIDNIYTNTFTKESYSGNILIEIADHLTQFVIVDNDISNLPITVKFKRDYSKYKDNSFIDDLSIQNWNRTDSNNPNIRYKEFIVKIESCINRHSPLKNLIKRILNYITNLGLLPLS